MSDKDTQQKKAFDFVLKSMSSLNGGAFPTVSAGALAKKPYVGKELRPYATAGRKQIAQQIVFAEKTKAASALISQAFTQSVADLSYTAQINMAVARAIPDEELAAFVEEYVRNGLNYLSVSHAQFLQVLQGHLEELIKQGVEPSLMERLFGQE